MRAQSIVFGAGVFFSYGCAVADGVIVPSALAVDTDASPPESSGGIVSGEAGGSGGLQSSGSGGRGRLTGAGGVSSNGGIPAWVSNGGSATTPSSGGVPSTGGVTADGGAASDTGGTPSASGAPPGGGAPSPAPPLPTTGTLTHKTTAGGRSYLVYTPASLPAGIPVPLLFVHHGYNGSADQVRTLTHFDVIAEERHFVAVFPEGAGATWNAGLGVCGFGQFVTGVSDDFGFEQEMIAAVSASTPIDRRRVFVTGFSMGGYFSNNIGCMRPDLVKGIAPHSGGGPPVGCANSHMPAFIVHGTLDPLIFYQCGTQARDFWTTHNGCSSAVDVVAVKGGSCEWSRGCPSDGQVVFCHMDGMTHGWAGVDSSIKDGGGAQYENISRAIWSFFEKQ